MSYLAQLRQIGTTIKLDWRLRFHKGPVVAFGVSSIGELQFLEPIMTRFVERHPDQLIVIVLTRPTIAEFNSAIPWLKDRAVFITRLCLLEVALPDIDLFITSEQYDLGLDGVYSILSFHGQPSKAMTFTPTIIENFDALFLYGPMHREAFDEFVREWLPRFPPHLDIFEIGYPKSDALLNGKYSRVEVLRSLQLPLERRTVLYAPAFNEGASLRECGPELIEALARRDAWNVIVKLPMNCRYGLTETYHTGGVDWYEAVRNLEKKYSNVRLYFPDPIDPVMACSDVLVTCVSSVGFEFMALNKPVVFLDTPKFYCETLQKVFPGRDTAAWANRTTVNGGREFGLVAGDISELTGVVEAVLANPREYPRQQERLKEYLLYNRGRATETAVDQIEQLLARRVKSRRPRRLPRVYRHLMNRVRAKLLPAGVKI